jgi:hypothetical protein
MSSVRQQRADFQALGRQRLIGSVPVRSAGRQVPRVLTLTRDGHTLARSRFTAMFRPRDDQPHLEFILNI